MTSAQWGTPRGPSRRPNSHGEGRIPAPQPRPLVRGGPGPSRPVGPPIPARDRRGNRLTNCHAHQLPRPPGRRGPRPSARPLTESIEENGDHRGEQWPGRAAGIAEARGLRDGCAPSFESPLPRSATAASRPSSADQSPPATAPLPRRRRRSRSALRQRGHDPTRCPGRPALRSSGPTAGVPGTSTRRAATRELVPAPSGLRPPPLGRAPEARGRPRPSRRRPAGTPKDHDPER
jgi:hypothetical protein